jgi:hypothetical protein
MGTNGVVPDKPVNEFVVKEQNIVSQERKVSLYEVFRERTIEPLDRTVHLGTTWVGMVVCHTTLCTSIMEKVCELTPVISLYLGDLKWSNLNEFSEKV